MRICVVDASLVIAALIDGGPEGRWAEEELLGAHLAAPHLLPAEVTNILRRLVLAGKLSRDLAAMAHDDLRKLPIDYYPYELTAARVWSLHDNVTAYDAWYVALAELLDAPLCTLDQRLSRATGPRCSFRVP